MMTIDNMSSFAQKLRLHCQRDMIRPAWQLLRLIKCCFPVVIEPKP